MVVLKNPQQQVHTYIKEMEQTDDTKETMRLSVTGDKPFISVSDKEQCHAPAVLTQKLVSIKQNSYTTDDGLLFTQGSLVQNLINIKCDECQAKNMYSKCNTVFGLVNSISLKCQNCGKVKEISTNPRTRGEESQVNKHIMEYILNSQGGQALFKELLKISTKLEIVEDAKVKQEVSIPEINIKEETQDAEDVLSMNGLEVPGHVETFVGLERRDLISKDDTDASHLGPFMMKHPSSVRISQPDQHLQGLISKWPDPNELETRRSSSTERVQTIPCVRRPRCMDSPCRLYRNLDHSLETITKRLRCRVCFRSGKRKDTKYKCKSCGVALCPAPCHSLYHCKIKYWVGLH